MRKQTSPAANAPAPAIAFSRPASIHAEAVAVGDLAPDLPGEHHRGITQAHR
jgi:hypothetical protein